MVSRKVWFTSDHHFGHERVAVDHRGYPDSQAHDLDLVERHNSIVRPTDLVYFLGDLCAGGAAGAHHALRMVEQMNGSKRLIAGNHDPVHPMHRDAWKWQPVYALTFDAVSPFARVALPGGLRALLSHFPYHRDRGAPRHTQYRLRNEGMWLLHGHTHGTERVSTVERSEVDPGRSVLEVHVGLDAWDRYPVDADTIASHIAGYVQRGRA